MEGATDAAADRQNVLERYELLELIARGPRGETWRGAPRRGVSPEVVAGALDGADEGHAPRIIIKLMDPSHASPRWLEAQRLLGQLHHPSIIPVLDAGLDRTGRPFVVTPGHRSDPLPQWYAAHAGRLSGPEAMVAVVVDICAALAAVHRRGLLHLGLKPGNVLIRHEDDGQAVGLVDFALPPTPEAATFIAPEVLAGGSGTVRSDVFGVGMLLLRLLSAGDPANARLDYDTSADKLTQLGAVWMARLEQRIGELPAFLIDTIDRALRPDPADRHPSVEALGRELRQGLFESAGRFEQARDGQGRDDLDHVDIRDGLMGDLIHERTERGPVLKFFLRHRDQDGAWRRSGAFFFAPQRVDPRSTYHSLYGAWAGAELSLFHARATTKGNERYYTHDEQTLPILEPYFLIAVTDVIKAQGCATRYLTDLRDSGGTSKALVVGRIVHNMLEALARRTPQEAEEDLWPDFDQLYDRTLIDCRLDLLAAGQQDKDLKRLRKEVLKHYDNLRELITAEGQRLAGAAAEVKRFSGEYGLEGRIDLALDDDQAFRILELKTGKPYDEHAQQVRCYALLWDKVAASLGKRVVGELIYSKDGALTEVDRQSATEERSIIQARNGIVSMHRHFAYGDTGFKPPHYLNYPERCREPACRYRKERCQHQTLITGQGPSGHERLVSRPGGAWAGVEPRLVALARAYYRRFVRFIEAEHWNSSQLLGQILRGDTLEERCQSLKAVDELSISAVDPGAGRVAFTGGNLQIFSPGQKLIAHRGDFHSGQIFTGNVLHAGPNELILETGAAQSAGRLDPAGWILDLHPTRLGYRERHRALFDFLRTRDERRLRLILERQAPHQPPAADAVWLSDLDHLNEQQRDAVTEAVTSTAAYLIQGPPGTGKTTVIAEIIRHLVAQGQRVLLAAGTNTAVDNVLIRLLETNFDHFLRLGGNGADNGLRRYLIDRGQDPARHFADDMARACDGSLDALARDLLDRPVIAATTHTAISSPAIEIFERLQGHDRSKNHDLPIIFDVAILDEAGQITEPMALGAINRARRFVLVGDHQQLPPVVTSDRANSAHIEADTPQSRLDERLQEVSGVRGLDQSLFERLFGHVPSTMLEVQYRMNQALMAFSSRTFYEGRMGAAPHIADLSLPIDPHRLAELPAHIAAILDPTHPLTMVDVHGHELMRQNEAEAALIIDLLGALLEPGLVVPREHPRPLAPHQLPEEIGVITPFRAQVQLLRRHIGERFPQHADRIEVDTVERFQGREKEIMLVSFVVSGRTSAFIADARRLNVTLTRARSKLIVLGHLGSLAQTSVLFRQLMDQPETHIVHAPGQVDLDF